MVYAPHGNGSLGQQIHHQLGTIPLNFPACKCFIRELIAPFTFSSGLSNEQNKPTSSIYDNNEYPQYCLDAVMVAAFKYDEQNKFCGGTTSYRTADGTIVLLTQAKSYYHWGPSFANYSQLKLSASFNSKTKNHWHKILTTVKTFVSLSVVLRAQPMLNAHFLTTRL